MHRPGRCGVRELRDRIDDPAPTRFAGGVAVRCKLVRPSGALLLRRFAVPPEHQVGGAPDVDLGHHAEKASRRPTTNCYRAPEEPSPQTLTSAYRSLQTRAECGGCRPAARPVARPGC